MQFSWSYIYQIRYTFFYNSQLVCLFLYLLVCWSGNYSQIIGPELLKFQSLMDITLGTLQQSLLKIGLFSNSSQTIGPENLKYALFNEGDPGVVMRKFGEDQSKTLSVV